MALRWVGSGGACLLLAATMGACTVGPDFEALPRPVTPQATSELAGETLKGGVVVPSAWWKVLDDPVLDTIEQRVLHANLELAEAATRIEQARASLRVAGASGLPRAGAAASYLRERASDNGTRSLGSSAGPLPGSAGGADPAGATSVPASGEAFDLFQAGFDASWELDLWGRNRRAREAAGADMQAAILDHEAARISLSAEVARTYMMLRGAETRVRLLESNREIVRAGLHIANARQQRGVATRYDAATAATQLSAIDAQLPLAQRQTAEARNALALLAGEEPHALDALLAQPEAAIPGSIGGLPASLPSDLARSRPDIMAAEAELHAATARIGMAEADFYPSISLTGSFGLQSLTTGLLPEWDSRQFIAGPAVRLPIFEGGRLKGRLQLAEAGQKRAAIRYRAAVLRAWHEIDNALTAVRAEDARAVAAQEGLEQSRVAAHVAERRYERGASGYLDVIVAQRARLERESEWAQAQTDRAVALAALYKALGGGWMPPQSPADAAG